MEKEELKDLVVFGGKTFYMEKAELKKIMIDYSQMFEEIDNVYKSDYKQEDGEFVHYQSFSWGFQEGVNYCLRLIRENLE
jgi:hypothetical protein